MVIKNKLNSLMVQVSFFVLLSISIIMVTFATYNYSQVSDKLGIKLKSELAMSAGRLATSLRLLIYQYDVDGMVENIKSEMNNPLITAVGVEYLGT